MLVSFSVENFLSFNSKETLLLTAGKGRNFSDRIYYNKTKLLKFAALFGANGSGKSNFVKAIAFARNYILSDIRFASLPTYYKLDAECINKPSLFEFKIILNNREYTYGFKCILNSNDITEEWLYDDTTTNRKVILYRNIESGEHSVDKYFKNTLLNTTLTVHADGIKNDSGMLLLRVLNRYKNIFEEYPEAGILKDIFSWFEQKLRIVFPSEEINDYSYFMSAKNMESIVDLFKEFGFSISSYKMATCSFDRIASQIPKNIYDDIIDNINKSFEDADKQIVESVLGIGKELFLITKENDELKCETIQFFHEDPSVPFSMSEESDGTLRMLKLMEILLQDDDEIVYIVDEVDRCLHALLTYNYVYRFLKKAEKTNNQLVVTTHESLLLDYNLLRKDEMWFISKSAGASHLQSLGSTNERADKKRVKSYLLGDVAVPIIKDDIYRKNSNIQ